MGLALTNEERFLASCNNVGEADVRQKLSAGRYSGRRAEWASGWLDERDIGKSDATKAEEKSGGLLDAKKHSRFHFKTWRVFSVLLAAALMAYLVMR